MRLTIVTDTYVPSINGVARTLEKTVEILRERGHAVTVIHPGLFRTVPLPRYPEIDIACNPWRVGAMIEASEPDSLHIAVEGSLGFAAKIWADRRGYAYTTSYHTRFPEYVQSHYGFGEGGGYRLLRWFHRRSVNILANTETMRQHLIEKGFTNLALWGRGVDTALFTPDGDRDPVMAALPGPVLLNVGRVSIEKNLPAFYETKCPGTKVQVGDGPMLSSYRERYPDVVFLGAKRGADLAACYRSADLFVFPSRTDTYGLVMLEAMASGLPVAAYPVPGPLDVVNPGRDGVMHDDLAIAIAEAAKLSRGDARQSALARNWQECTTQFESYLVPIVTR